MKKFDKKIFSSFNDIGIRKKLVIVYIFCICIPTILISFIWASMTLTEIEENNTMQLDNIVERIKTDFIQITMNAVNVGNLISNDANLYEDLTLSFSSAEEYYEFFNSRLRNRFGMYSSSNLDIFNITLYTHNKYHQNSDYLQYVNDDVKDREWYKKLEEDKEEMCLTITDRSEYLSGDATYLRIARKIITKHRNVPYEYYLTVDLKLDKILSEMNRKAGDMEIYIINKDRSEILSPLSSTRNLSVSVIESLEKDSRYYVSSKAISDSGFLEEFMVLGIYDKSELIKQRNKSLLFSVSISALFAIIAIFIIYLTLNSVVYRISILTKHMKKVVDIGFVPLEYENPGKDEVGTLIHFFNNMIDEINSLIRDVYSLEVKQKKLELESVRSELKYLQSQVDPHFLFNTLNAIMVFSVKNNYTEVVEVISNLSGLLKRLLVQGDEMITIETELDFIEKYLCIEKFRFGEKFSYKIEADEDVLNVKIPKMSVQPLVENACKHGLQSSKDKRMLTVRCFKTEDGVSISVKDNGIGMEQEKVELIMETLSLPDGEEKIELGIGLTNVYRRLKLYYKDMADMTIKSAVGEGTEIVLHWRAER